MKRKIRTIMALSLCAAFVFTAGASSVRAAGEDNSSAGTASGVTIQYDSDTTIHSVGSGDDTLVLYCMNNSLHWPHTTETITSVPSYNETTLAAFCADKGVNYTDALQSGLEALLYAGYPYNGFGLYKLVDSVPTSLTDEEFNALLTPPQYLRDDFPDSLGTTTFTLANSVSGENYSKLNQFMQETYAYSGGKTTDSGLTYAQIQKTDFWRAAYCLLNFGSSAKEAYVNIYATGYNVTKEQAYEATRNAVWQYLYQSGVPDNTGVDTNTLADNLLAAAGEYSVLKTEPSSAEVSLSGDLSFYYSEADGKWHTYPLTLSVPDNYNASFRLVLPDGVREESGRTEVTKSDSFSFVADDPAEFISIGFTAEIPWMVGDLKVYEPAEGTASDGKGFQNMVGAVIRTTGISTTFQIVKKSSITVTKVWDDNNDQDGKRPDKVEVQLKAGGEGRGSAVTLSADNNWTYTWEKVPLVENGTVISYTVTEVNTPDGYTSGVSGSAADGFVITNSHTPQTTTTTTATTTTSETETQTTTTATSVTETPTTTTQATTAATVPVQPQTTTTPAAPQTTTTTTAPAAPQTTTTTPAGSESAASGTESTSLSSVSPCGAEQDTETSASDTPDVTGEVPSTGDSSHMGLFGIIMAVCAGAIMVNLALRRRRKE